MNVSNLPTNSDEEEAAKRVTAAGVKFNSEQAVIVSIGRSLGYPAMAIELRTRPGMTAREAAEIIAKHHFKKLRKAGHVTGTTEAQHVKETLNLLGIPSD